MIRNILNEVSAENLKHDLFYLCREPFIFRTVSYTAPWHEKNSLDEVDDFLVERCSALPGVRARKIPNKIRPFRCDRTKNIHHWYELPHDGDPWFDAANVEATIPGKTLPDEIIQLVSHKDSMSWIESPGAHDNATGVIANLEILRILSGLNLKRTVRVLFCNEEHNPWHSRTYAAAARERNAQIPAVRNPDSIDGKAPED
ncbi:MAG: M28 family peptidase [Victivallaceae bacterium]|nr:M28 family peptidase [Victivallaceae bacterium]